jgi:hypothetical protein
MRGAQAERLTKQVRDAAEEAEGEGGAAEADDDDDDDEGVRGGGAGSEWAQQTKDVLKAERQRRLKEDGDDDDDDEPLDEREEMVELLRRQADAAAPAEEAPAASASTGAGGKRPKPSGDDAAERAKVQKTREAALSRGDGGGEVLERDMVLLLHQRERSGARMPIKELIKHFKPFVSTPEKQASFMKMVAKVAYQSDEHVTDPKTKAPKVVKVAKLREEMTAKYGLDEA